MEAAGGHPRPQSSCDVREAALIRYGKDKVVAVAAAPSRADAGSTPTPPTRTTRRATSTSTTIVPLGNAYRSGAASWGAAKKERFANVPLDLLAVEDNANAAKADDGPEDWKPPQDAYHCAYSKKWINVNLPPAQGRELATHGNR